MLEGRPGLRLTISDLLILICARALARTAGDGPVHAGRTACRRGGQHRPGDRHPQRAGGPGDPAPPTAWRCRIWFAIGRS